MDHRRSPSSLCCACFAVVNSDFPSSLGHGIRAQNPSILLAILFAILPSLLRRKGTTVTQRYFLQTSTSCVPSYARSKALEYSLHLGSTYHHTHPSTSTSASTPSALLLPPFPSFAILHDPLAKPSQNVPCHGLAIFLPPPPAASSSSRLREGAPSEQRCTV